MAALKECTEALLSSTTVDLTAAAATTLYTVPAGKTLILTKAVLVIGSGHSNVTTALTIGRSTALTDFLNTQTLSNLDAVGDVAILQPVPNATTALGKKYAAGVIIQVNVTDEDANASSANTMLLFGILY